MQTISVVTVIGELEGTPERKAIDTRNGQRKVTEFRVAGCGLRIAAWEERADAVPDEGIVLVQGYLSTRTYEYQGQERTSTDIRATNVQLVTAVAATDNDDLIPD